MRYLVTADEMRRLDQYTIEEIGIPAAVLMERAALAVADRVRNYCMGHPDAGRTALVMAGMGNNGGDGLALARILTEREMDVTVWCVGDEDRASAEWKRQKKILGKYSVNFCSKPDRNEYTILIDALFGVGLSRAVAGIQAAAVECFNGLRGRKFAVDVPSGIDSDTGAILGSCVRAEETVTFGYCKRGLVLYPGCVQAGEVTVADIGIAGNCPQLEEPGMYALDGEPGQLLPAREPAGNKGSFGKVLLIAGSVNMAGAAILAAKAAYRSGAGMVKVISSAENREILQTAVPEALFGTERELSAGMDWADVIAIGPGLGRDGRAAELLRQVLCRGERPTLIDADGLNLLSEQPELRRLLAESAGNGRAVVLTPHVGELARLLGRSIAEIKEDLCRYGDSLAMELQAVVVAKDARTFICRAGQPVCVNLSGNSGLATAGSGDVLAGMIAGLMAQDMDAYEAACTGAYIHGCLGDRVSGQYGEHACMAGDLVSRKEWSLR